MKPFADYLNEKWNSFLARDLTSFPLKENEIFISYLSIDWRDIYGMLISQEDLQKNGYMVAGDSIHELFQSFLGIEFSEIPIRMEDEGVVFRGRIDYFYPYECVPVEIKTVKELPEFPYERHLAQLLAYEKFLNVNYGYLLYISRNSLLYRVFRIPFSKIRWKMVLHAVKTALYLYHHDFKGGGLNGKKHFERS